MKYISTGAVKTAGTEYILEVTRGAKTFQLTGEQASLWLNGRKGFSQTTQPSEDNALKQLIRMGLALKTNGEFCEEYRTLTQCTIVPAERMYPFWGLTSLEKTVLRWLREAGLVLSMAELVYLIDRKIPLSENLLGSYHTQALVEQIYTKDTIFDNVLENQMERAAARDRTVDAVLSLLRKKRIVLL